MKKIVILFSVIIMSDTSIARDFSLYKKEIFTRNNETLRYRILYPENYEAEKKYPVITFLHGSAERGADNESQLIHGGRFFLNDNIRKAYEAIVIFPQLPKQKSWIAYTAKNDLLSITKKIVDFSLRSRPSIDALLVKLLLDSLIDKKIADNSRMYIGGLSLGGFGTFGMIERYPGFFAAAFSICGGSITKASEKIAGNTSVWMFHGDDDNYVDVKNSREYYAALKRLNADVRYNEYHGVGHNSWDNAFAEKDLMPWLFSKKKKSE